MTEKPFRDEDVVFKADYAHYSVAYTKSPASKDGLAVWVKPEDLDWYEGSAPEMSDMAELLRQLQASQERCGRLEEALRDIAGTEGANEYDAPAIARAALRKPRKKAALAHQGKGGGA